MKSKNPRRRRCRHCGRHFTPNPRVKDRQVTCGADECQQAQHNEACRDWHKRNRENARDHYRDVVVPFRERHPGYQSRYRLLSRLREIREEISRVLAGWISTLGRVAKACRRTELVSSVEDAQPRSETRFFYGLPDRATDLVARLRETEHRLELAAGAATE